MYLVPAPSLSISSCSTLNEHGISTTTKEAKFYLVYRKQQNRVLGSCTKQGADDLFKANIILPQRGAVINSTAKTRGNETDGAPGLWHLRMDHVPKDTVRNMMHTGKFEISTNDKLLKDDCKVCTYMKNTRKPCRGKLIEGSEEITIHAYICRPFDLASYRGARDFLTLKNTSHRYTEVTVMKDRKMFIHTCESYISWIERNTET